MKNKALIILFLLSLLLTGCHVISADNLFDRSPAPKILPGYGSLSGTIIKGTEQIPLSGISIHLAQVVRSDGSIVFVYDAANSPSTVSVENGSFIFEKINSGEYVIIMGDDLSGRQIISTEEENAQIWIIHPDQVTDTGQLLLD